MEVIIKISLDGKAFQMLGISPTTSKEIQRIASALPEMKEDDIKDADCYSKIIKILKEDLTEITYTKPNKHQLLDHLGNNCGSVVVSK